MSVMKSYGQFCGLARALDRVGDRWTLLIVRELLIGPCRYSDLRSGLPGVATNLLADRLHQLEADGLVTKRALAPSAASTVYELTPLGASLEEAVLALTRWGGQFVAQGRGTDAFQARWLILALRSLVSSEPAGVRGSIDVVFEEGRIRLNAHDRDPIAITLAGQDPADALLTTDAETLLAVASGLRSATQAQRSGSLRVRGDRALVRQVMSQFGSRRHHQEVINDS